MKKLIAGWAAVIGASLILWACVGMAALWVWKKLNP